MKRVFKIIVIISLVLVLLVCGVIAYLATTIDLDQIKQQISTTVKEKTGRDRFFITRESLRRPEPYIARLLKEKPEEPET